MTTANLFLVATDGAYSFTTDILMRDFDPAGDVFQQCLAAAQDWQQRRALHHEPAIPSLFGAVVIWQDAAGRWYDQSIGEAHA